MSNQPIIERDAEGRVTAIDCRHLPGARSWYRYKRYPRNPEWRDDDGDPPTSPLVPPLLNAIGALVEAPQATERELILARREGFAAASVNSGYSHARARYRAVQQYPLQRQERLSTGEAVRMTDGVPEVPTALPGRWQPINGMNLKLLTADDYRLLADLRDRPTEEVET